MESTVDKGALIGTRCLCTNVEHAHLWKRTFDNEWVTMIEPGEIAFEHLPGDVADLVDCIPSYGKRL